MNEQKPKDFIPPIGQQKKKSNIGKFFVILIVVFIAMWALAIAIGDKYSFGFNEKKKPSNLIQISGYDFYILEDYTFGTFLNAGDKKIPIAFRLDPRQAGNISLDYAVIQKILSAPKIYLTFNPNQRGLGKFAVAAAEISRITSLYQIPTVGAYTEDSNPINPSVPIKTCADANKTVVIELLLTESTGVTAEGNCVRVKGTNADNLILAADKLGMNLIGIKL